MIEQIEKRFTIKQVTGDGNCFFRAILKASNNDENEHFLRVLVCEYIRNNTDIFESEIITKEYISDYSNKLKIYNIWATKLAIYATALLLDLCICIYIPGYSKPLQVNESVCKMKIFLLNSNRNNLEVLEPNSFN